VDTLPGGIVRITSATPADWADTTGWKLTLDYTVQAPAGTPGELMQPFGLAVRNDGHLLVGDDGPAQAKLYGPDGTFIRAIGREGDGPGEYRSVNPGWVGDTVFIQDTRGPGRGATFLMTGEPIATFPAVCCMSGPAVVADARHRGRITGMGTPIPGQFTSRWIWFDTQGRRLDSLDVPSLRSGATWQIDQGGGGVATYGIPFEGYWLAETLRDGRIIHGYTRDYELLLSRDGRDTTTIVKRDPVDAVPIPDSIRTRVLEGMTTRPGYVSGARLEDIPTTYPYWSTIDEDGEGNLWIGRVGGIGAVSGYDVFSPDGHFRGTVPAPWRAPWRVSWGGDRVAVLDLDENDLPRIRVFRVAR
jgi:hypothetical protein